MLQADFAAWLKQQCETWGKDPRILLSSTSSTIGGAALRSIIRDFYEDAALELWRILGDYSKKRVIGNNGKTPKNLFDPMLQRGGSSNFGNKEVFFTATGTDIKVTLKPSAFDYFWRESLYPAGYPDGATDIVGLVTHGWGPVASSKRAFGHWANAGINIKAPVGMPARPFVRDAIADYQSRYAHLNVRVTKVPSAWA